MPVILRSAYSATQDPRAHVNHVLAHNRERLSICGIVAENDPIPGGDVCGRCRRMIDGDPSRLRPRAPRPEDL